MNFSIKVLPLRGTGMYNLKSKHPGCQVVIIIGSCWVICWLLVVLFCSSSLCLVVVLVGRQTLDPQNLPLSLLGAPGKYRVRGRQRAENRNKNAINVTNVMICLPLHCKKPKTAKTKTETNI